MGVMVPAGTNRLSPACNVTGGLPSSCQTPVAGQDVEGDFAAGCRCRGLTAPGGIACPKRSLLARRVRLVSLFRSGAWVMPGLFLADHGLGLQRAHARKRRECGTRWEEICRQKHPLGWSRASIADLISWPGSQMRPSL